MEEYVQLSQVSAIVVGIMWIILTWTAVFIAVGSAANQQGGRIHWYWSAGMGAVSCLLTPWAGEILFYLFPEVSSAIHKYRIEYILPGLISLSVAVWIETVFWNHYRFQETFTVSPWYRYTREANHIQDAVDDKLKTLAGHLHGVCQTQNSKTHLANIGSEDFAGLVKAEIAQAAAVANAKNAFWRAHALAKYFGFEVKMKYGDYLAVNPTASEADPTS